MDVRTIRPCYAFFAGLILLSFLFLTRTYYWDGVLFSLDIENVQRTGDAASLFHPNHLLYNAFGFAVFCAAKFFDPAVRAIAALQAINVVLSVASTYVLFLVARCVSTSRGIPEFCCCLFAFGATWWKFSTDADVYIVCVLLLVLNAWFLLRTVPVILHAALCHTAAMLFHELAIFTYVPVLFVTLFEPSKPVRTRVVTAVAYCAGTGSVVAAAYWLCYSQANHSKYPTLLAWITSYASDSEFTHSFADVVQHYLASYLKQFAGGKLSMMKQFFSPLECLALIACGLLLIWAVRLFVRRGVQNPGKIEPRAMQFLWGWFIGYAVFLGLWDPGSAFHKLFIWPAIVLLIGAYIARCGYGREHVRAFTIVAAALACWNFAAFIYPRSHTSADPVLTLAQQVNRELPKNATVYYRFFSPDDWYLDYFAPGRTWKQLPGDPNQRSLNAGGGPVCLETTALETLTSDPVPTLSWRLVEGGHNIRLACFTRL
jgi:hypothetical protein